MIGNLSKTQMTIIIVFAAVLIGFIAYNIMKATGIIKTKEGKELKKEKELKKISDFTAPKRLKGLNFVNTDFWKGKNPNNLFTDEYVTELATKIYKSWGLVNDNEEKVISVCKQATTRAKVSQLCYAYFNVSGIDLPVDLIDKLGNDELNEIVSFWEKL